MTFEERHRRREELCNLNSPEMEALKVRGNAAGSAEERLTIAVEMSNEARRLMLLALHAENPFWTINELLVHYFRCICFPQPLPAGAVNAILEHRYEDGAFNLPM